jgi:hypothetical protein
VPFHQFTGKNPTKWRDKCQDYFKIFDIPESMWATYDAMNKDENAAEWLQMYKKFGVSDWGTFMEVVKKKFWDNDYRTTLTQLLKLQQNDFLDTYILSFEDLQYQVTMHNSELVDLFFITQFITGSNWRLAQQSNLSSLIHWREQYCWPGFNSKYWKKGEPNGRDHLLNYLSLCLKGMLKLLLKLVTCGKRDKQEITEEPMDYVTFVLNHMTSTTRVSISRSHKHQHNLMHWH